MRDGKRGAGAAAQRGFGRAPATVGLELGEGLVFDDDGVALGQLHLDLFVLVHGRQERLGGQHRREIAELGFPFPALTPLYFCSVSLTDTDALCRINMLPKTTSCCR